MIQTVTAIEIRTRGDAFRQEYALGVLACGHACEITMLPDVGSCGKCGKFFSLGELSEQRCACGYNGYRPYWRPEARNPQHRLRDVGDKVECSDCDTFAAALERLRGHVASGKIQHTRFREHFGGVIHLYQRDRTSPTGVRELDSIDARPEAFALLNGTNSPLSPTEGR